MLTSDQKRGIKTVLSTIPKKDTFASLTPTEKKEAFLGKKGIFYAYFRRDYRQD